ncbi:MAG: CRTAC1 family protein [Planctomycetota bacterium]
MSAEHERADSWTPRNTTGLFFTHAAEATGLLHTHGPVPQTGMLAGTTAAGGAVADFDGDGYQDVFVLGGGLNADALFINNGDGTFTERADVWGADRWHHSYGASAADFDGDGDTDLFITSYGSSETGPAAGRLLLLRNDLVDGRRVFTDIAQASGVATLLGDLIDGTGSGWGDYDLDGDLDLFVCAYERTVAGNRLFRNDGPGEAGSWSFTDVTDQAGLARTHTQGFLPRFVDLDMDRHPELVLVADTGSSRVFYNNKDGTFRDETDRSRGIEQMNAMGIDIADVNQDGRFDYYVTNIDYGFRVNILMVQNPDGSFDDTGEQSGVDNGYWGWGALMLDLDNDGDIDIAETNGGYAQFSGKPSLIFLNDGDGNTFTESSEALGFAHNGQGRGLVRIDIENDGDLDLLIICNNQPLSVHRNELIGPDRATPPDAGWLRVLLDTDQRAGLAPDGTGAIVRIRSASFGGTGERIASVDNGSNHCTTSPAEAHFGLGAIDRIDHVRVEWADGTHTTLGGVDANQILTIAAPFHPADFDGSGSIDALDASAYVDAFLLGDLNADIDADWDLDFFDVAAFVGVLRSGL